MKPRVLFVYNSSPMQETRLKTLHAWREITEVVAVLFAYPKDYEPSLLSRILRKFKIPLDPGKLNSAIEKGVSKLNPDFVFIVKGVTVKPSTLKNLKSKTKIVSWTNDDMYAWHNRSLWYTLGLKYYDLVVTQKSYNCNSNELPSLGAKVFFQNKAFEPSVHRPVSNCKDFNCVHDVTFIGAKEDDRLEHLLYLAKNGIKVHVYGWVVKEPELLHENLIIHDRFLYEDEFCAALGCSKIALNFLRKMNRDVQTSRSIEIPACGGFMLAERTTEHQSLFSEGKEAEYFDSKEELLDKVRYYLENDDKRISIAKAGYDRCFSSNYTFKNRMEEILKELDFGI